MILESASNLLNLIEAYYKRQAGEGGCDSLSNVLPGGIYPLSIAWRLWVLKYGIMNYKMYFNGTSLSMKIRLS